MVQSQELEDQVSSQLYENNHLSSATCSETSDVEKNMFAACSNSAERENIQTDGYTQDTNVSEVYFLNYDIVKILLLVNQLK